MKKGTEIILINDSLYLKEYTVTKKVSLNDLAKKLVKIESTIETPMLPLNTIKFKNDIAFNYYYILIPEDYYNVRVGTANKEYAVRFPNMIFKFKFSKVDNHFQNVCLYWTQEKIVNLNSRVFNIPPLQNVNSSDGMLCSGGYKKGDSQAESIELYINAFFTNSFNTDLSSGKKLIPKVASEQKKMINKVQDEHELINLWWYFLSEDNVITSKSYVNSTFLNKIVI